MKCSRQSAISEWLHCAKRKASRDPARHFAPTKRSETYARSWFFWGRQARQKGYWLYCTVRYRSSGSTYYKIFDLISVRSSAWLLRFNNNNIETIVYYRKTALVGNWRNLSVDQSGSGSERREGEWAASLPGSRAHLLESLLALRLPQRLVYRVPVALCKIAYLILLRIGVTIAKQIT